MVEKFDNVAAAVPRSACCATILHKKKKTHKNTNEFVLIFEIYIFHFPTNGRHHGEQKPTDLFLASSINLRRIIFYAIRRHICPHARAARKTAFWIFSLFFRPKKCRAKKPTTCLETSHRIAINYCRFVIIFHSVWKRMHIQSSFLVKRRMWRTNVESQNFWQPPEWSARVRDVLFRVHIFETPIQSEMLHIQSKRVQTQKRSQPKWRMNIE